MPLTGTQFQQLQQALLSAFPTHAALAQMVRFGLGENLDAVAGTGKLDDVVFQLITWTEAQGREIELVTTAHEKNPGNSALKEFVERFPQRATRLSANEVSGSTDPPGVLFGVPAHAGQTVPDTSRRVAEPVERTSNPPLLNTSNVRNEKTIVFAIKARIDYQTYRKGNALTMEKTSAL